MFYTTFAGYYTSDYTGKSKERITHNYELELCTTSNSQSMLDDQIYNRIAGSMLVVKPMQKRQSIGAFEAHSVHFSCSDEEFCRKYLNPLPTQIFNIDTYKFSQYLKDLVFLHQNQNTENSEEIRLLRDSKLTTMIVELYTGAKSQQTSNEATKYAPNIAAACQFITEHFQEPIGIEEIARTAMLSTSFTYVMFKKATGMTPHDFLVNTRIHYACEQLIYTSKSIAEISMDSGFSNANYLNYIFSKHIGMTPGQYRRSYRRKLD